MTACIIGLSITQTGTFSMMGIDALHGVQFWMSDLERKGGIRVGEQLLPVRLIIRDDRSRTSAVRKNIESLINEDHEG